MGLDKACSVQVFLKEQRIITELIKGVASMATFVYPSYLQK